MTGEDSATSDLTTQQSPARWGALAVLACTGLFPATAARRSPDLPLRTAYLLHWLAAIIGAVVIILLVARADSLSRNRSLVWGVEHVVDGMVREYARNWQRWPGETFAATFGVVAGVEAGFALLGLLVVPWGAVDEPMKASIANGLRRAWLHTAHVVVIILLLGSLAVALESARYAWLRANSMDNVASSPQPAYPGPNATQAEIAAYQAAYAKWHQENAPAWSRYWARRPWHVRHIDELMGYAGFTMFAWFLWALLRGVAARPELPAVNRPPTCDFCGYNLVATPPEGRCPECGEAVQASIGPGVRPGADWHRRGEIGRLKAWCGTFWEGLRWPALLARRVPMVTPGVDHRRFMAACLPLVAAMAAIVIALAFYADTGRKPWNEPEILYAVAPAVAYCTAVAAFGLTLVAAWCAALWWRWGDSRNQLGPAMRLASYLAGWLVLGLAVLGVVTVTCVADRRVVRVLADYLKMFRFVLAAVLMMAVFAAGVLVYVFQVVRAVGASRFANR